MKTFGLIFTIACLIVINLNETFEYAIDRQNDSNNSRSLSSPTQAEKGQMNDANKPTASPVHENAKIDGINEVDLKSIIHPGHKVKRCKSMTPLRKPRFTPTVKMVNNEKNEGQFQNSLNKNEVITESSSKLNNNATELRIIEADAEDENASSKKSSTFPITKTLHQIDERPEISIEEGDIPSNGDEVDLPNDKVKRHNEKKKKKYVCYCVEDGCTKNHARPNQKSNKNQLSSQILRSSDLYSQLSALEREDSSENYEEDQAESLLGSKSNGGKKRPGNKRPKNKKCMPVVIPCSITENESPTKIKIPINGESTPPSTINPYHAPNNYQSYQTVPNVPNYYGSPYVVYHPVHAVNLPGQQRSMEDDRLGGVHGLYNDEYMEPEERSRLEECIQLYGADYCLSARNFNDYTNSYHLHDPTYGGIYGNYPGEHGLIDSSNEFIDTPEDSVIYSKYYHQGNQDDDDNDDDYDDDYQVGSDREMPENKGQRLLGHYQMSEPLEGSRHFPEKETIPESTEMNDMMDDDDHFQTDRLTQPVDDFPIYDGSTESDESQQLGITPIIENSRYRPSSHGTTVSEEDFEPTNEPMYSPGTGIRDQTEIDGYTDSNYYSDEFEDDVDTQVESGRRVPGRHQTIEPMTEDQAEIFAPVEGPTHLPELGRSPQDNRMNDDDDYDDVHDENDHRDTDRYREPVNDFPIEETSTESSKFQHLGRPMNSNRHKPIIVQPGFDNRNPNVPSQTPQYGDRSTSIPDLFQHQSYPNNRNEDDNENDDTINQGMSNSSPPSNDYSDENVSSDYEDYVENSSEQLSVASPPEVHEPNSHKYVHNPNYSTTESSGTEPSLGHQPGAIRIEAAPQDYTSSTENIDNYDNYDEQYESGPHDETLEQSNEYKSTHENPQEARQPDAPEEYQPSSEFAAAPQKLQTSTEHAPHFPELVCPNPETVSASAEKHLEDLQALTGLSPKDSLLLRGTIYKAINQLASNTRENSRITSLCDVISAPEPSQIERLAEVPVLKNVFNVPEVRDLILNTVKSLISQATSVSRKSSLGKLTDNAIDNAISIVLGDDVPIDSEDPHLGIANDNAPISEIIKRIIKSIINRPGIGLYGARFPEIQSIIVQSVENIVNRAKNVVDKSVIWDALNDVLDRSRRPDHHTPPVIPRPPAYGNKPHSRPSVHGTKPLPHISVIEHSKKNGQWQEESATVGYHDEYPKARNPGYLAASGDDSALLGEREETVTNENEDIAMYPPTTYHSPGNIKVKYIKDHSEEPSNLGSVDSGSNEEESMPDEEYSENEDDNNLGAIRIPPLGHSHQATTESYSESSTKGTKSRYSSSGKNKAVQQFRESDGEPLEAARVYPENGETPDDPSPSTFLGKITSDSDLSSINNVEDLVSANLYYVGDGAKLPLTVTRMSDGSFALSISNKVCEHFVKENCPCCAAKLENVRISSNSGDEGIRMRQTRRRGHSRQIRATTANENEGISTVGDMPTVTEMPADKFAEKYNLTLSFDKKNEIKSFDGTKGWQKKIASLSSNDLISSKSVGGSVNDPEKVKVVLQLSDESEMMDDIQKNQYIQDLLSIHDVPEQNRAELVINALDGLLNSSPNTRVHDDGSIGNNIKGFEYQVDNPIMERMKYINENEIKRGKYKYQQNIDEAAEERMETAKSILHWLKELLFQSKGNNIS